jgi:hypothetical protein
VADYRGAFERKAWLSDAGRVASTKILRLSSVMAILALRDLPITDAAARRRQPADRSDDADEADRRRSTRSSYGNRPNTTFSSCCTQATTLAGPKQCSPARRSADARSLPFAPRTSRVLLGGLKRVEDFRSSTAANEERRLWTSRARPRGHSTYILNRAVTA